MHCGHRQRQRRRRVGGHDGHLDRHRHLPEQHGRAPVRLLVRHGAHGGRAPSWQQEQGWTAASSQTFSTTGWAVGDYWLRVGVSNATPAAVQTGANLSLQLVVAGAGQPIAPVEVAPFPCTAVALGTNVPNAPLGDPVTATATPSCPSSGAAVRYVFWVSPATGAAVWTDASQWTGSPVFTFDTTGWPAGGYLLLVWVSNGAPTQPQAQQEVSFTLTAQGAFLVSGISQYQRQIYNEDCEEASLQIALEHDGIAASQPTILGVEGVNSSVPGIGPGLSGDPYKTFVGPPNGLPAPNYEPGTYYPVVARAAKALGAVVLASGQGISALQLFTDVEDNHPAVVWITFSWKHFDATTICAQGDCFPWAGNNEHAVTVIGIGVNAVLIDNPWPISSGGSAYYGPDVWVPMAVFASAYTTYSDMAVVLQ